MSSSWLLILAAVAVIAGVLARRRTGRTVRDQRHMVTDETLRRVLEQGEVELAEPDEPLDEEGIREAEKEFWENEWDDPEPWHE